MADSLRHVHGDRLQLAPLAGRSPTARASRAPCTDRLRSASSQLTHLPGKSTDCVSAFFDDAVSAVNLQFGSVPVFLLRQPHVRDASLSRRRLEPELEEEPQALPVDHEVEHLGPAKLLVERKLLRGLRADHRLGRTPKGREDERGDGRWGVGVEGSSEENAGPRRRRARTPHLPLVRYVSRGVPCMRYTWKPT